MAKKGKIIWHARKIRVLHSDPEIAAEACEPVAREFHMALRADGKVIERTVCLFPATHADPATTTCRHDYGWKLAKRPLKKEFVNNPGAARQALTGAGFEIIA